MGEVIGLVAAGLAAVSVCVGLWVALRLGATSERLRLLLEQGLAGQRSGVETGRVMLGEVERSLAVRIDQHRVDMADLLGALTTRLAREQGEDRVLLESKLREMADMTALRLAEIQKSVNEQLHEAVEKQMQTSFQRVIEQFGAVQKAMGDVQAVTAQIGDLKRIFSNVKSRGFWGETQLRALLDDLLPAGSYETNVKLREGSGEIVEFAVRMPIRGEMRPLLAIDAKFPVSDYERLMEAAEAGDPEGERGARRGLEARFRLEARRISEKYIVPPVTVEFAVLYLPTDGLYAEAARVPGLLDELGRVQKVMVMGPSLLPALLRTVQLGYVTLALEQKTDLISQLLSATKAEMLKMDGVLDKLANNAGAMARTIDEARVRTRAVGRKLRGVEVLDPARADLLLALDGPLDGAETEAP